MRGGRIAIAVGSMIAVVLALLVIVAGAWAATGVDISVVEGQPFSGNVVTGLSCPLNSATITWGDGTADSTGTSNGNAGITGTHTYTQAGTYTGSVSYTYAASVHSCPSGVQTTSFQATVQDAALSATGVDVSGTAGQPLSAVVAHVDDANPSADPMQLSAQITWGDGTTTAGTVAAAAGGGFGVTGAHTYATAGVYSIVTSITDVGGSTADATATATVITTTTTTTTTTTSGPPLASNPRVLRIDSLAPPVAGSPIVLSAVTDTKASSIAWNLAGDSRPEITCSGAQTAVSFRAPAGTRSVSVTAFGPGGGGPPLTQVVAVASAAPLSAAQRLVAARVSRALAKKAPVYTCTAPTDFSIHRVGGHTSLTDNIVTRACTVPRTTVIGGLQFEGCLRRLTSENQIPGNMRGMLPSFGQHLNLGNKFPTNSALSSVDLVFGLTDAYITYGDVKVNGLTLSPGSDAAIVVAPQIDELVSSNAQMAVGNVQLQNSRSFIMNLASRGGNIPLGSFARAASGLADIAGFALDGDVDVALDDSGGTFGLTIHVHLSLPKFLEVGGASAQGDVTLRATNADGLVIDNLRIGPIDAEIAGLGIDGLQLDYARASDEWAGQGRACIAGAACLDMIPPNGGVLIRDGSLVRAAASIDFSPVGGLPLFAGVVLNRIGFGIGLDPTRILANADITAEEVLEIDGHLVMAFPSDRDPFVLDRAEVGDAFPADFYNRRYTQTTFAIAADAFFDLPIAGRTRLGGAYLLYQVPGYVGFGGGIDAHFSVVSLTGRVDGEFNFGNGRFSVKGDVTACVVGICAGAIGAVSDRGAGGCVHIGTFLGDINIGGGVEFSPFEIDLWPFDGCRWSPFVDTHVFPAKDAAAAAAGAPIAVHVRRGEPSHAIRLDGVGGAPSVQVSTPSGELLTSSPGSGLELNRAVRILRDEKLGITVVGLVKPKPGTYSIELLPGSPALKAMSQASDQRPAGATGSVSGTGIRRTLVYNIRRRTAQRVTFVEQANGGSRTIGTITGGGKGRLSFTPAPGLGRRTIVAEFELAGMPAERMTIASFTPPSPHLRTPGHLHVTRHGTTLSIEWTAVAGATRYEVVARLSHAGEQLLRTRSAGTSLHGIERYDGGRISVRAIATLRQGKAALVTLRPAGRTPTRLRRLPAPPRRHR